MAWRSLMLNRFFTTQKLNFQKNGKFKKLKQQLIHAENYTEWKEIALQLDQAEEVLAWKYEDSSPYFDADILDYRLKRLIKYRHQHRIEDLIFILKEGMTYDIANICHPLLFTVCFAGTKQIIESYLDEINRSLSYILHTDKISTSQKKQFFEDCAITYGQPALMFSGGATLGLFHSGVCKALKEQDLLPKVLSGSSAGAIMAATLGTCSAEKLDDFLKGSTLFHDILQFRSLKEMWSDYDGFGGFTDVTYLKQFLIEQLGDVTFAEAYEYSGLNINIAVAPYDASQMPRILNRYTSPDLLVWSAVLASCAVPVLFPAIQLTAKREDGRHVPFMAHTRWVDGSMRSDFPQEKMARLYNINYTIASQANPHVVPFMQEDSARFRNDLLSWPERIIRRQGKVLAKGMMDFTRERMDLLPPVRRLLDHGYGIVNQHYYGDINIIGKYNLKHYSYLLQNPQPHLFKQLQKEGEQATWARMAMIESHAKIGKALDYALKHLKNV